MPAPTYVALRGPHIVSSKNRRSSQHKRKLGPSPLNPAYHMSYSTDFSSSIGDDHSPIQFPTNASSNEENSLSLIQSSPGSDHCIRLPVTDRPLLAQGNSALVNARADYTQSMSLTNSSDSRALIRTTANNSLEQVPLPPHRVRSASDGQCRFSSPRSSSATLPPRSATDQQRSLSPRSPSTALPQSSSGQRAWSSPRFCSTPLPDDHRTNPTDMVVCHLSNIIGNLAKEYAHDARVVTEKHLAVVEKQVELAEVRIKEAAEVRIREVKEAAQERVEAAEMRTQEAKVDAERRIEEAKVDAERRVQEHKALLEKRLEAAEMRTQEAKVDAERRVQEHKALLEKRLEAAERRAEQAEECEREMMRQLVGRHVSSKD